VIAATDLFVPRRLAGVSLRAERGQVVALLGKNGAGKSTLLACLSGDLAPASGAVQLDGVTLASLHRRELARRRAVLPQHSPLVAPLRVIDLVRLATDDADRVEAVLAEVGLAELASRVYPTLSGGEKARAQLARVLAQLDGPGWLLLDEPLASLDPREQVRVGDILRARAAAGCGVMVVLHDLNAAAELADRVVLMRDGRIVGETLDEATLEAAYGTRFDVRAWPGRRAPVIVPRYGAESVSTTVCSPSPAQTISGQRAEPPGVTAAPSQVAPLAVKRSGT
jgi:iron complex transport system ATP-binding protein